MAAAGRTLALLFSLLPAAVWAAPADTVYRNGYVYTIDAHNSVQQALAVRNGRIAYVGDDDGAGAHIGPKTRVIDLQGRMLMPGLIDAHMHPQSGGSRLLNCSLDYQRLTVPQFQARIQACLDKEKDDPKRWLIVVNWFQQGMQPENVDMTHAALDVLKTSRPIVVRSSFGHSVLLNSKAMQLAKVTRDAKAPPAGKIARDAQGEPTGILEDAAQDLAMDLLPPLTPKENLSATKAALDAMRRQGVTTFLDAFTDPETLTAYRDVQRAGKLTARAHFAVLIDHDKDAPGKRVAAAVKLAKQFDQGAVRPAPSMQVRHAKLFMDGVISAPAFTGAMLEPYWVNRGTAEQPDWGPGTDNGPASYFSPALLRATLNALAKAKLDPHIHTDGDRAVRDTLDALQDVRKTAAGKALRAALAHGEIIDPADYPRFVQLDATPVLSFQWAKPAPDTIGALKDYMGPKRYETVEPQAVLQAAGARIAFGSDWPVDPLDQWFALKVAVTRMAAPDAGPEYAGRLTQQPGMTVADALRAMTINAAYTLRMEQQTGSLEVGKLADMIILDRNVFDIAPEDLASVKVEQTVVGGRTVWP
ncbi:amidohydrolase [Pseudoduganella ginsengisoli]|uniref:Amidohydrolase family protein n=1 Tax=Pseudoduganella ginsengisoli TaxID=1462440 RepID=A0A6L6PVV0_9BURK|nr:amidohydrolase [Pseudoduganella ginsengisoli]MTW01244.1 amidohydrolase family protein [Pseudoduganella ginsengisoli]